MQLIVINQFDSTIYKIKRDKERERVLKSSSLAGSLNIKY